MIKERTLQAAEDEMGNPCLSTYPRSYDTQGWKMPTEVPGYLDRLSEPRLTPAGLVRMCKAAAET